MMNKLRYGVATVAFAAALGLNPAAHAADNANADATAEVLSALTLTVATNTKLDFGAMVVSGAGTVSLAADGTLDCSDTDIVCSGTTGIPTFNVAGGTSGKAVSINLPTGTVQLVRQGSAGSLASDVIELGSFVDSSSGEVTLDGTGASSFEVGGTITLDGTETPGIFDGQFNVSIEYS